MSGVIAIVGRPNVGKSALFNRIVGKRIAIVHDRPGVTRDRVSAEAEWDGRRFTLIDTGGIGLRRGERSDDVITRATVDQVELAIQDAQVVIFVVSVQEGVVALDQEVASRLRQSGKSVVLAVNKVDEARHESLADEFAALGFLPLFPVSAAHDVGVSALMDAVLGEVPSPSSVAVEDLGEPSDDDDATVEEGDDSEGALKLAIVGRPNVGKSSLINALTQSERVIVSAIAGTTRDAVDVPFEVERDGRRQHYVLIDTAGIRKRGRVGDSVEFFSVNRAERAIQRCDLAILVLDAEDGITEQDKKIAGKIVDEHKGCIVVINKWDLVAEDLDAARREVWKERSQGRNRRSSSGAEEPMLRLNEFGEWVQSRLFFIDYAPVIFTSALSGFHLDRLLEAVRFVYDQMRQQVPTGLLNRTIRDAVERRQPPSSRGSRLKFYYATQVATAPPAFVLFVNRKDLFSPAYEKYLANELRRALGFEGCPVRLIVKPRPKTIPTIRRSRRKVTKR